MLKALKAYEFVEELTNYIFEYPDDDYMTMECLCRKLVKYDLIDKEDGYYLVANGIKADRKTENSSEKPNNCEDEPQLYITENRDTQILDAWQTREKPKTTDCPWK